MAKQETMRTPVLTRLATIESHRAEGEGEDDRRVRLAFSSEEPVKRWFGTEILGHQPGEVDLGFIGSGRGPLLVDHDTRDQIGVVEQAEIGSDRVGRATVRFGRSERAEEILRDVREGIRQNISVGYRINKWLVDEDEEEHRAVSWSPLEISIVSVPADTSVGVGRSGEEQFDTIIERRSSGKPQHEQESTVMTDSTNAREGKPAHEPKIDVKAETDKAVASERARIADIQALGARHNMAKDAEQFIREGKSLELFRGHVLDKIGDSKPLEQPGNDVGLNPKERQQYSLARAIRTVVANKTKGRNDSCFEFEVSDQVAKQLGRDAQGFFLPSGIGFGQRDLTTSTGDTPKAGYLKGTDHLGDEFIDVLRSRLVTAAAGARMLTGLKGDIDIPALTTATTAYWVAEGSAPTEGAPVFGQKTASPKTVAAFVDFTRRILQQSDPSVEQVIRGDLVAQLARAVDDVAIEGGATNAPTGILGTSGIGSVTIGTNGGALTWSILAQVWKEVAIDNADVGKLAWLTTPGVVYEMLTTPKVSSTDSNMIMNSLADGLLGYPVFSSNLVPGDLTKGSGSSLNAIIFGNFADLMICEWSGIDLMVDPYTLSSSGGVRLTAFYDVDVVVRHAQSFAECNEIVVA